MVWGGCEETDGDCICSSGDVDAGRSIEIRNLKMWSSDNSSSKLRAQHSHLSASSICEVLRTRLKRRSVGPARWAASAVALRIRRGNRIFFGGAAGTISSSSSSGRVLFSTSSGRVLLFILVSKVSKRSVTSSISSLVVAISFNMVRLVCWSGEMKELELGFVMNN